MTKKSTQTLRYLYALFLMGTGLMTLGFHWNPPQWPASPAGEFLVAAGATGYLVGWVGLFKFTTGLLMVLRKTEKLAYLMALPYTVNITLWVTLVAHEWVWIGIPNFTASVILIGVHYKSYLPIFAIQPEVQSDDALVA